MDAVNALLAYCNLSLITCLVTFAMFTSVEVRRRSEHGVNPAHLQILTSAINASITKYMASPAPEQLTVEQVDAVWSQARFDGKRFQSCFRALQAEWGGAEHGDIESRLKIWNAIVSSKYAYRETLTELPILLDDDGDDDFAYFRCDYF